MKAVVIGAGGHIGSAIARELLARGWEVTATSRRAEPGVNLRELELCYSAGASETPGQLDRWIAGQDLVVDAAAPYPQAPFSAPGRTEEQAKKRMEELVEAIRRHGPRLVYVSSFTTLPLPRSAYDGISAYAPRGLHPYFRVKEMMEAEVMQAARDGLPAVVINPTMCLGPWDLKPAAISFVPQLLRGNVPLSVDHILNVVDVREVALAAVNAVEVEHYGEPTLVSGHNIGMDALFSWICELAEVPPPRRRSPASLSLFASFLAEAYLTLSREPLAAPFLAMMLVCQHRSLGLSKVQRALGVWPRPLSATLADTIEWYRSAGYC